VSAGSDISITLPVNTRSSYDVGTDADGTISSYSWTKVSGGAASITSASSASTSITGLAQGVYVFRLTVTDNQGVTASDDVTVTVNAASSSSNQSPIANAGPDQTITLPVNSVTLNGSGVDSDGTIISYSWNNIIGGSATIVSASSASTSINGLTQGVYVFRLTVTDNQGATATDDVTVTVNAAPNVAPIANAGPDITITLP